MVIDMRSPAMLSLAANAEVQRTQRYVRRFVAGAAREISDELPQEAMVLR